MIPLICKHCEKDFGHSFENWELHLLAAHNKRPIMQCKQCDVKLVGVEEFDRHQEFEHGRKMLSISLGLKFYSRKYGEMLKK